MSGATAQALRLKLLKALRRGPHRYDAWRSLGMTASIGILLGVPLSGMARVDLWRGDHRLWFAPVGFKAGLAGVLIGVSAMYVVTFLSNVVAGRMFCGWGCPVGQVSRFGEALDTPGLPAAARRRALLESLGFTCLFVFSLLVWWVDPRVLWDGSRREMAAAWGVLALGTLLGHLHGRFWRWNFCKQACPIGLYYTFMSPASWYGVYFRNAAATCIECDACDHVCPVDLAPRELMTPISARGGLSIEGAPGRNHCLECGDCVRACEFMIAKRGHEPVPLLLGLYHGPQRIDVAEGVPAAPPPGAP